VFSGGSGKVGIGQPRFNSAENFRSFCLAIGFSRGIVKAVTDPLTLRLKSNSIKA